MSNLHNKSSRRRNTRRQGSSAYSSNRAAAQSSRRSSRVSSARSGVASSRMNQQKNAQANAHTFDRSAYGSGDRPAVSYASASSRSALENEHARLSRNNNPEAYVQSHKQAKKKNKRKKVALICLVIAAVLVLGGAGAAFAYYSQIQDSLHRNVDEDLLDSLAVNDSPSDPFYMLLIGADRSEAREASGKFSGSYRTDSMILARIDPQNKKVTMVSVPRDTQVTLEGYGTQKINAAYAIGGPAMAVDAVSDLADVPISHYAEVDFDGFRAVVDALGGVEVNVPMEINDDKAGGHVDAGEQTLNGTQALILARSRHTYDDYGDGDALRAANQRVILSAIMKKIMSSDVGTLTNTVSTLAEYVTTDFNVSEIVGLAQRLQGIDTDNDVYTASVPTTSSYENNLWYEIVNEDEWKTMMKRVDEGLSPTEESQVDEATGVIVSTAGDGGSSSSSGDDGQVSLSGVTVAIKNGSGISGCASEAANKLTPLGVVAETGNADSFNYKTTLVIYEKANQKASAQAIADALGKGEVKLNDGSYSYKGDYLVVVGQDWAS